MFSSLQSRLIRIVAFTAALLFSVLTPVSCAGIGQSTSSVLTPAGTPSSVSSLETSAESATAEPRSNSETSLTEGPIEPSTTLSDPTPSDPTSSDPTPSESEPSPSVPTDENEFIGSEISEGLKRLNVENLRALHDIKLLGKYLIGAGEDANSSYVAVYDLTTGKEINYVTVNTYYGGILPLDRGGFACTSGTGYFLCFSSVDDAEPVLLKEDVLDPQFGDVGYDPFYFYSDGSYIRIVQTEEPDAFDTAEYGNVFTGQSETLKLNVDGVYFIFDGKEENLLYFRASGYESDMQTAYIFDLETKTVVEKTEEFDRDTYVFSDYRVVCSPGTLTVYDNDLYRDGSSVTLFRRGEFFMQSDGKGKRILTTFYREGENEIQTIYDFSGDPLYRGSLYTEGYIERALFTEHGLLVLVSVYDEETESFHCTLEFLDLREVTAPEKPEFDENNKKLISEIESRYPVTVLTGEDAIIDFPDFTGEVCDDVQMIYEGLLTLRDFLQSFPEGFIDELFAQSEYSTPTHLTVCYTGALAPVGDYGISNPAAYAYSSFDIQYIVLDLYQKNYILTNLAHEMMHAIDRHLDGIYEYNTYPEWYKYVPDMSVYNYGYKGEDGYDYYNDRYTPGTDDVWFIDSYSKTYPTEDRARLFENMFTFGGYAYWTEYSHVTDRMKYLAQVIRASFKCMETCDEAIWERFM